MGNDLFKTSLRDRFCVSKACRSNLVIVLLNRVRDCFASRVVPYSFAMTRSDVKLWLSGCFSTRRLLRFVLSSTRQNSQWRGGRTHRPIHANRHSITSLRGWFSRRKILKKQSRVRVSYRVRDCFARLAVTWSFAILAMTCYHFNTSSYKSFQSGLISLISASFLSLEPPFSCFSRAIASSIEWNASQ